MNPTNPHRTSARSVAAAPIPLAANQPARCYRGGAQIAAFRGVPAGGGTAPEDWVASTTTLFGEDRAGLSLLPDGRTLRAAIASDPVGFLGPAHVAAFGPETGLLVKLLDAGQRLPVHVHPSRAFAARHVGCRYGKTEAWIVLGTDENGLGGGADTAPVVYVGLREDVDGDTLADLVSTQDTRALLGLLNPLPVAPGDTILVPAGTPHAIGGGVFVLELQEPTDLSVLLEWSGFGTAGSAFLGLDPTVALDCVDRAACTGKRLAELRSGRPHRGAGPVRLLPPAADTYFRAELLSARDGEPVAFDAGFGVLVVTFGEGELVTSAGGALPVRRGHTVLVPWSAGTAELRGTPAVRAYRCRPPAEPPPPLPPPSAAPRHQ